MKLRKLAIVLAICPQQAVVRGQDTIRGVGPEFYKFYTNHETFTCISNPNTKIPASRVNDDYCDCPDGSDEPGTAACGYLSPQSPNTHPPPSTPGVYNTSPALPGFYCENKGHNPAYIPFTHVNDGICDHEACCDGSDEWMQPGGTKCENKCKSIGAEWRKADEKRQISLTSASRKRVELVAGASKKKKEIQDWIASTKALLDGQQTKVKQLEKEVDTIEKSERAKVVRKVGAGGKAAVLAGLAKETLAAHRNALMHVMHEREAENARLGELESLLATFQQEYNPNFNDEGVKRAVRGFEEYVARNNAVSDAEGRDRDAADQDADDLVSSGDGIPWQEFETEEEGIIGDIETLYSFEEYLPPSLKEWLDGKLRVLRQLLVDNGFLAPHSDPDSSGTTESTAVTEAKNRLHSAQTDLSTTERERDDHNSALTRDYGPDDVFRTMDGNCIATDSGEYTYELCWMDSVTQKPKKGGMHNNMGRFSRFDSVHVDEDVSADGKGLGSGERLAMRYEGGNGCWQGPQRQTTVVMGCAEVEEIWRVVEEEKCIYRTEVGTPAVCEVPVGVTQDAKGIGKGKDEL